MINTDLVMQLILADSLQKSPQVQADKSRRGRITRLSLAAISDSSAACILSHYASRAVDPKTIVSQCLCGVQVLLKINSIFF